jgi:hypothetical protein
MRISALRKHIKSEYLDNKIISGAEARDLVRLASEGDLTAHAKGQLEKLRDEFQDSFSAAGLRDFNKALARAIDNSSHLGGAVGGGQSAVDVFAGRNLENLPTSFKLSEVKNPAVKKALRRLDLNIDGKVDHKDRDKLGLSDDQWRMFVFSATLMGSEVNVADDIVPTDLTGKKVCFTAVPDKAEAKAWAEAMGADVVTTVSEDLDFLIVGDKAITGKDERALALNALGVADIEVGTYPAFLKSAHAADVTGAGPTDHLPAAEYDAKVEAVAKDYWASFLEGWQDEIDNATDPARKAELKEKWDTELADFGMNELMEDEYKKDDIKVEYDYDDGFRYHDRFGVEIPFESLDFVSFSFYSDLAGIGLSKSWVFDKRTGEVVEEGPLMD